MPERKVIAEDAHQQNHAYEKGQRYQVEKSIDYLEAHATNTNSWRIYLPTPRDHHWYVQWSEGKTRHSVSFNKDAIPIETTTDTKGGLFFRNFHYTLQLRGYGGRYIAGVAAMSMLLALFTGIYTHRRFFKDFFTLRKGKVTKWTTDFHALIGIVTLPFCLMICISAIMIYAIMYMPFSANMHFEKGERGVNKAIIPSLPALSESTQAIDKRGMKKDILYSAILADLKIKWQESNAIKRITIESPLRENSRFIVERTKSLTVSNRAERLVYSSYTATPLEGYADESAPATFRRIMYGLHQANFATIGLRWLLFGLGILSCALIATGLMIWTNQRRANHLKTAYLRAENKGSIRGQQEGKSKRLSRLPLSVHIMEKGNVVVIMGIAIATAIFLLVNKLTPADAVGRANLEVNAFFIVWLCCAGHVMVRPVKKAWYEQAWIAALSYLTLAVVGACVPFQRTRDAFSSADITYLSFILVFLLCGLGFLALAFWLRDRWLKPDGLNVCPPCASLAAPTTTLPSSNEACTKESKESEEGGR